MQNGNKALAIAVVVAATIVGLCMCPDARGPILLAGFLGTLAIDELD